MRAVVVGRSAGALVEYEEACALCDFDCVLVVGKMGEVFPDRIDHWVSFHVALFDKWAETRAANGLPPAGHFWGGMHNGRRLGEAQTSRAPLNYVKSIGGSSGFLAAREVARGALAADRVVLAGVPMRAEDSHYAGAATAKEAGAAWSEADAYWRTWLTHAEEMRGYMRSMSGRTRDLLGAPTREWLQE